MTCYHPIRAFRTSSGSIQFREGSNVVGSLSVPCGQCIGCRLKRSRDWAIRCVHEASLHSSNCFITLTYSDQHLPADRSLHISHFQKFMKRFRKNTGTRLRFFHCGEYGEKYGRPHYHACIFGYDFSDKILFKTTNGVPLYTSEILSKLWPYGHSSVGLVTFQSAAYVARYIMKKVTGRNADDYYTRYCSYTGQVIQLHPEYTTMSRRPGIGSDWFKKYSSDVYPSDQVIINGKRMPPPPFYDKMFDKQSPFEMEEIKFQRHLDAKKWVDEQSESRLNTRERVQELALKRLPRTLD